MDGEKSPEVARRLAWINDVSGSQSLPLTVIIRAPREVSADEYRADATVSCELFEREVYAVGLDSLQSLAGIIRVTYGLLLGLQRRGYTVFWFEPGDLENSPLWGVSQD